jgi:hypothetical protein
LQPHLLHAPGDSFSRARAHLGTTPAAALPHPALDGRRRLFNVALDAARPCASAHCRALVRGARHAQHPRRAPVAAAVAEERKVLHVLARRHGRDALEGVLHRRNLLEHLRLARRAAAQGSDEQGRVSASSFGTLAPPAAGRAARPQAACSAQQAVLCSERARSSARASFSGGISRFASQSQAPLPSDTAPPPVPAAAGEMPSSLASPIAARGGIRRAVS